MLPSRTLAYGHCSTQGERFLVTLTRLRLPDGTEARFEGLALDLTDGKPGLLATRRIHIERAASETSLASDIGKGSASTVLSAPTAAAGLPGQLVNGLGQSALGQRVLDQRILKDALLLEEGIPFEVFLRQGF